MQFYNDDFNLIANPPYLPHGEYLQNYAKILIFFISLVFLQKHLFITGSMPSIYELFLNLILFLFLAIDFDKHKWAYT